MPEKNKVSCFSTMHKSSIYPGAFFTHCLEQDSNIFNFIKENKILPEDIISINRNITSNGYINISIWYASETAEIISN